MSKNKRRWGFTQEGKWLVWKHCQSEPWTGRKTRFRLLPWGARLWWACCSASLDPSVSVTGPQQRLVGQHPAPWRSPTHLCHRARRPQAVSLVRGKCMFEKRGRKGEVTCSLEHCVRKVLDCGVLLFLVGLFFCLFFVCNLDGHVLEF